MSRIVLFVICVISIIILLFSVFKQEENEELSESFQEGKFIGYLLNDDRRLDSGGNAWEVYVFNTTKKPDAMYSYNNSYEPLKPLVDNWEFYLKPLDKSYNGMYFVQINSSNITSIEPADVKLKHFKGSFIIRLTHPDLLDSPYKMIYVSKTILI